MNDIKVNEKLVNRCPKCGDVMGENIDGEPICACSVPPRSEDEQIHKTMLNLAHLSKDIVCVMPPEGVKDLRQWTKLRLTIESLTAYVNKYGRRPHRSR